MTQQHAASEKVSDNGSEQKPTIALELLTAAEEVIGLSFVDSERELMAEGVHEHRAQYEKLRKIAIDNSVPPAFSFDPRLPGMTFDTARKPFAVSAVSVPPLPDDLEEIAFWPVTYL